MTCVVPQYVFVVVDVDDTVVDIDGTVVDDKFVDVDDTVSSDPMIRNPCHFAQYLGSW